MSGSSLRSLTALTAGRFRLWLEIADRWFDIPSPAMPMWTPDSPGVVVASRRGWRKPARSPPRKLESTGCPVKTVIRREERLTRVRPRILGPTIAWMALVARRCGEQEPFRRWRPARRGQEESSRGRRFESASWRHLISCLIRRVLWPRARKAVRAGSTGGHPQLRPPLDSGCAAGSERSDDATAPAACLGQPATVQTAFVTDPVGIVVGGPSKASPPLKSCNCERASAA